jgi:hypothetical protein
MARTTTKIVVSKLIEALEAKRAELVAVNEGLEREIQEELATLERRQIEALEDAITAALDGKVVTQHRYHRDDTPENEHQLELPSPPYRHKAEVDKYDQALTILRLADPSSEQLIPHDGDFARLLR